MPGVNRTIIASTIIIMVAGFYHYFLQSKTKSTTITRILIGGYMLGLFASFFDLVGFGVGKVAGWILMLAVGVAIFTVVGDLSGRLGTIGQGGSSNSQGLSNTNASGLPTIPAIQTNATNQNFSGTPQQVSNATGVNNAVAGAQAGSNLVPSGLPKKFCVKPSSPFDLVGWSSYAICKIQGGSG